jgi:hypothetical protein
MSRNVSKNVRAITKGQCRARAVPARTAGFLLGTVYSCAKRRKESSVASLQTACPAASDEVAEAFVRGTLSPDRAALFGRHIGCCPKCADEVENHRAFVLAMCDALRAIDAKQRHKG